jgi:hypothetical protein
MTTIKPVDDGRIVFTGLKYMYITPWEKTEDGKLTLSSTTYEIVNIVGDTTSLEQEDNDVQEVEHEFSSTPLYEAVTLGKKTFSAECADYQEEVLVNLFGWKKIGDAVVAPASYKEFFAAIELGFNSTDEVVVLPKVRMDSKVTLASMKTDISRATISGTTYQAYAKVGSGDEFKTDMFISKASFAEGAESTYTLSNSTTKA